ncbi:hypothetical protein ACIQM4_28790 [Streptomyces sp. NPDC091272]|uniref:hypothetical protein n=1 Tax=Streptomyces sp. NPDC091272 TaxID=3365981 RepID=UPI0037FAE823
MMLPPAQEQTELIEVVRITDPMRHLNSEDLTGDDVAIWEAAQVSDTLRLIGSLPDSELYRCFIPSWGIRAHSDSDLLFQIAFCFRCHGARLWGPRVPGALNTIHSFAPDSPPARELLQRFHDSAPRQAQALLRRS